jgi:vacuolar-type H+-ATPase subunit I/STV1
MNLNQLIKYIFILGILIFSVMSILGMIYLTKVTFTDKKITKTENNITKITIILLWSQISLIILGTLIQTIYGNNILNFLN